LFGGRGRKSRKKANGGGLGVIPQKALRKGRNRYQNKSKKRVMFDLKKSRGGLGEIEIRWKRGDIHRES